MPSIGDMIFSLMGKPNPRDALLAGMGGGAAPPAPGGTPDAGGTAPAPSAPAPVPQEAQVYKSPSELMNLYIELQDRQQRNSQIDRGIGLMGASLAHPENRAGIMAAFNGSGSGSGGGSGGPGSMVNALMEFQTKNMTAQQKAAQRASVPAIAKQYGLDPETALYLFDSGSLDNVITEMSKGKKQIVKGADGRDYLVDLNTAEVSDPLTPEAPQELEIVEGEGGSKVVVDKKTKLPIKDRAPLVPADPYAGDTELSENWKRNNQDRKARGQEPLSMEAWKALQSSATQGAGIVDAKGNKYPDPPKDMVWDTKDGVVQLDERGAPKAVPIGGTEIDLKNREAADKAKEAEKSVAAQDEAKQQTSDIVTEDIGRLDKIINDNKDTWLPVTGMGSWLSGMPGTDAKDAEGLVTTIKANLGFDKLQAMRAASPTGAALGPVSDFENQLLQSVMGNLDLSQGREQVQYNLRRIKRLYSGVVNGEFVGPDGKPNMAAINAANQEAIKDTPIEDLLKMYGNKGK